MKRFLLALVLAGSAWAQDAREILEAARVNPLGQPILLEAQLRSGSSKVPFRIQVRDGAVSYLFQSPEQELRLTLGNETSTLEERKGSNGGTVSAARFDDPVRGGLLTYEDLAFRFLYWPQARLLGEETVERIPSYKIEVQAPAGESAYGVVRVWIGRENGALVAIEGFDKQGRLVKRFKVVSVQKLGDRWMLRQMRIERLDPETRKVDGRMYLEVLGETPQSQSGEG